MNSCTANFTLKDIKELIESSNSLITNNFKSEMQKFCDMFTPLLNKISDLERQNEELLLRIKRLEEKQDHKRKSSATAEPTCIPEEIFLREAEERNRRRDFIIISGLKECNSGSVNDRKLHDKQTFKDMMHSLNIPTFEPLEQARIGKVTSETPRLLRIRCPSYYTKMVLLTAARNLRNTNSNKKVYVNPDLTPMQRAKNKKLRTELKSRRERGEKVMIRGGEIVESEQKNFL